MNITEKISKAACQLLKEEIKNASGNEVFFKGILGESGIVETIEVLARGNKESAPAIIKRMKKEEVIIHNHPSGYLYPSDADVEVASYYANNFNGGFYIINNDSTNIYVVVDVYNEKNIAIEIKPYFEEQGLISKHFPDFEYRKEQLHMAQIIEDGFNEEKKVVVEAGTGTGKTLAYLIPGIEWAVKNKKRIIFSTNTINLQEQLLGKDIPLAKKVLGYDFKYLLVKGRGNYLCKRKYFNVIMGEKIDMSDFSIVEKNQFNDIIKWGRKTETGDKAELTFETDSNVWENFQSETDTCMGPKCSYKSECFFFKSREEKKKADVLITNHHLYFTDLAIRKEIGFTTEYSILPEYGAIVFDEAHNIEKVARDYFSCEVSKLGFTKLLNKIENIDRRKRRVTSLEMVEDECKKLKSEESLKLINELRIRHKKFADESKNYFNSIIELFTIEKQESASVRLKKNDITKINELDKLSYLTKHFSDSYKDYQKIGRQLSKILRELEDAHGTINELIKYLERLEDFVSSVRFIDSMEDDGYIYWIEVNRKKGYSKRVATPLKVDGELQKNLFINLKTIIFTSATLAVGKSFKYFKDSIGLRDKALEEVILSPFDYEKQMKVYIPKDFPDPNMKNFSDEVASYLRELLVATKGRTFVLFTSYSMLNFSYYSVRETLEKNGIELYIHGVAPRTQLVELFKKSDRPVLFGTDSFWEGVDIKGEKLSSVVIVKLPFKVPNDPITEAIIENIGLEGKDPFTEYQIPEAVIKFKQGIGRLIRSKSDRGIITILDNRVITKRYGNYFINSIPTKNIIIETKKDILKDVSLDTED
ncbi:MAG: helicase C-terminal domain-containing protein [Fusobacteriaceae bacterium]